MGGVILSAAKDLSSGRAQILRCAQDDSLGRGARFKKTYPRKPPKGGGITCPPDRVPRPYHTRAGQADPSYGRGDHVRDKSDC